MNELINNKSKTIKETIENLPYFSISDLMPIEKNKNYLKVLFYRLSKQGKIRTLKRGMYVGEKFFGNIEKKNAISEYSEFVGNVIYKPSYLSLEYMLEKYGVLSESVNSFTLVSKKKTKKFSNHLGIFKYYNIREKLFVGFEIAKKSSFWIAEATLPKALFDFLYFRKNILFSEKQIDELRLNLDSFTKKNFRELKKYIKLENSKRMKEIFEYIIKKV